MSVFRLPCGSMVKNPPANARDTGLMPDWENSTCLATTKPMCHNYWACTLELGSHNCWAPMPQLLELPHPRAWALWKEKPPQWEAHAALRSSPHLTQLEKSPCSNEDPAQIKGNKIIKSKFTNLQKKFTKCQGFSFYNPLDFTPFKNYSLFSL